MTTIAINNVSIDNYLPFGLQLNDVVAIGAGLAVLTAFFALWQALRANTAFERRLVTIADKKEAMRQSALATKRQRTQLTPASMIHELVSRLNLLRSKHATEARMTLARAGMRSNEAMIRYLFARVALPVVFAIAALLDGYTLQLLPIPPQFRLLGATVAAALGFYAPGVYIKNRITKRAKLMQLGLPDALDLMIICAEAGLSLDATLARVSRELASTCPELAEELAITSAELTFLPDRRQAFENLNNRTDMPAVRGVVNTLLQTAKFGTPLAQSLRVLAAEYRDARMFRAEEKAARLPALMTVPMILFILPTLFIVLMGPAALGIIDTFNHGGSGAKQVTVVSRSSSGSGGSGGDAAQTSQVTEVNGAAAGDSGAEAHQPPPTVTAMRQAVAVGDSLNVDVDARALASGSNARLVLVPADAPDSVSDPGKFFADSQTVSPTQMQVSLTAKTAGQSEVRLYYIPSGSTYVVAARATVTVTPK